MMKKYLFLILLLTGFARVFPQKGIGNQSNIKQDSQTISFTLKQKDRGKIDYFKGLYNQSNKINDVKKKIEALQNLALINYESHQNYTLVLDYLEEIKKLTRKDDYYILSNGCIIESGIFIELGLQKKAKKSLKACFNLNKKIDNQNEKFIANTLYYKTLTLYYKNINRQDSVVYFSKKMTSESFLIDGSYPNKISLVTEAANILCMASLSLNDFDNAKKQMLLLEIYTKNTADKRNLSLYYLNKAIFHINTKAASSIIIKYLNHAETLAFQINDIYLLGKIYPEIAHQYKLQNDLKKQAVYLEKSQNIKNIIYLNESKNLQEIRFQVKEESSWSTRYKLFFIIILSSIIFLILIKKRNEKKENYEMSESQSDIDENELQIAFLYDLALKGDGSFYLNFLKKYPDFSDKLLLINSTIKASDIEFCALIKIGLKDRQIAESKKLSLKAVSAKKYRIRKKLNLSDNENTSLWLKYF